MSKSDEYLSPAATWAAIRSAARTGSAAKGVPTRDMVNLLLFDRLLAREFAGPDAPFVLKGGTRMLAFIPTARATVDIDLETSRYDVSAAVKHLEQLVGIDIGDRLRFTLQRQVRRITSDDQPNISMVALTFEAVGTGQRVKIDLAIHDRAGASIVRAAPEFRIPLGRDVPSPEYVMIATEVQIADKVAAMMERNHSGDGRSSRAKDLVDLALIAQHLSCAAGSGARHPETRAQPRPIYPGGCVTGDSGQLRNGREEGGNANTDVAGSRSPHKPADRTGPGRLRDDRHMAPSRANVASQVSENVFEVATADQFPTYRALRNGALPELRPRQESRAELGGI